MEGWKQDSKEISKSTYAEILGFNELATATAEDNAKQKGSMS